MARQLHKMSLVPRPQSVDTQPCTKSSLAAMSDKDGDPRVCLEKRLCGRIDVRCPIFDFDICKLLDKRLARDWLGSSRKDLSSSIGTRFVSVFDREAVENTLSAALGRTGSSLPTRSFRDRVGGSSDEYKSNPGDTSECGPKTVSMGC